jgi:SAM-dependent methyltransferase
MSQQTIDEFGEQWSRFGAADGYFGSVEVLKDIFGPVLSLDDVRGHAVVEIGSGNGRIVNMLLDAGARHVTAVEPSAGVAQLARNTRERAKRVTILQTPGESLPAIDADLALSIGVLHHIEDPRPVVRRVYEVLPPGGRFLIWVYGRENNGAYVAFAETLRLVTRVVPDFVLAGIAHVLNLFLSVYVLLCRYLPLPLATYMREVMARFDRQKRYFLIFDQLNVGYAKYYTQEEVRALLAGAGFRNVEVYHRHGMSHTAVGTKPLEAQGKAC